MYYVRSASSISYQNSFSKKGFSEDIIPLDQNSKLIEPNYKEYIETGMLRRMSSIVRMSLACSVDSIKQAGVNEPDAIIVGTGLGCLGDTEKFLAAVVSIDDHLLSPTPFIQSTHNTVAGQLSLILKNHNYNMTHTQNNLSFEHALLDGLMCLDEGKENILVGAADEQIPILNDIAEKLNYKGLALTSGSSFFILSTKKSEQTNVKIAGVKVVCGEFSPIKEINKFLNELNVESNSIEKILYSNLDNDLVKELNTQFKGKLPDDFQKYSGTYFSNSAFALHLAIDMMEKEKFKRILICNNLYSSNLGLTLIETH